MINILELSEYTVELPRQIQLENSLLKERNRLLLIGLTLSLAALGILFIIQHYGIDPYENKNPGPN